MKLSIFRTAAEAAAAAASIVAGQMQRRPRAVLGLPTGRTPLGIYDELVRLHEAGRADFSETHTLNLDEFIGLSSTDRRSFCAFMKKHLFRKINLPPGHIHFLDGNAPDLDQECVRYERLIGHLGGIDLLLLGVGVNGHIGFNEPSSALQVRTHIARLTLGTRRANASLFGGDVRAVPLRALSMGMATILEATSLVLVAMGRSKARAVESIFSGRMTTASPVSFLQLHPDVQVVLDRAAASTLPQGLREQNHGRLAGVEAP